MRASCCHGLNVDTSPTGQTPICPQCALHESTHRGRFAATIREFIQERLRLLPHQLRRALAALTGRYILVSRPSGEFLKPKRPYQADAPSFGSTTMNLMPMSSEIEIQLLMACSSRTEPIPMWAESSRTASLPMSAAGNSLLPRPEVLLRDTPALQIVAVDRE